MFLFGEGAAFNPFETAFDAETAIDVVCVEAEVTRVGPDIASGEPREWEGGGVGVLNGVDIVRADPQIALNVKKGLALGGALSP